MLFHLLIFITNFCSIIAQTSAFADKIAAMSKQTEENEPDNAMAKAIGVFAPNPENKNKGKRPKKPKNKNKNKNSNSYGGNNYVNRPKSPPKKTKPPKTTRPTYPTYTTRTYGQETTPVAKTYPPTYPPIKRPLGCWHCDAPSMEECEKIGVYRTCPHNAQSCMIETRKRNGITEQVCMGCKEYAACNANRKQNFIRGRFGQCRPEQPNGPSVCRQCCTTDQCTRFFNPTSYLGWAKPNF